MNTEVIYSLNALLKRSLLFSGLVFFVYGCGPKTNNSPNADFAQTSCTINTGSGTLSKTTYVSKTSNSSKTLARPKNLTYKVISKHNIESPSFIQGLQYQQGRLYKSSGLYGKSYISSEDFPAPSSTKKKPIKVKLNDQFFGEGLTLHKEKLYQLTWKSGKVFVYTPSTLRSIAELSLAGEGWGVSSDGNYLYISNGSASVQVVDEQLSKIKTIEVQLGSRPLRNLNELEWVNGCLFANVWKSNSIAVIEPTNGKVIALVNAEPLVKDQQRLSQERLASTKDASPPLDVLNGIAYRADTNTLLLTGKNWSKIYEIQLDIDISDKL